MIADINRPMTDFIRDGAPHLQEKEKLVGSIIQLPHLETISRIDSVGKTYYQHLFFAIINYQWFKISMEEYDRFVFTNEYKRREVDGDIEFPTKIQIIGATPRLSYKDEPYKYYKAYKGRSEYSKYGGINHPDLVDTGEIPGLGYGLVQNYTVKILEW